MDDNVNTEEIKPVENNVVKEFPEDKKGEKQPQKLYASASSSIGEVFTDEIIYDSAEGAINGHGVEMQEFISKSFSQA